MSAWITKYNGGALFEEGSLFEIYGATHHGREGWELWEDLDTGPVFVSKHNTCKQAIQAAEKISKARVKEQVQTTPSLVKPLTFVYHVEFQTRWLDGNFCEHKELGFSEFYSTLELAKASAEVHIKNWTEDLGIKTRIEWVEKYSGILGREIRETGPTNNYFRIKPVVVKNCL